MIKSLGLVLLSAIVLRIIISAITYHSDIQTYDLASYVIGQGNILNFYDYLPNLDKSNPVVNNFPNFNFNYPPAVYFVVSLIATIFNFIFGSEFLLNFIINPRQLFGTFDVYLHLLLLKLPLLIVELSTIWLIYNAVKEPRLSGAYNAVKDKLFEVPKEARVALFLWLFNPVVIFAVFMVGQFDIIPVFFTVLSLFFLKKYHYEPNKGMGLAALSLGVGSAFKIYPLFLIIPLVSLTDNWKTRFKLIILGIIPYLLTVLPFLPSEGFRSSALLAGQTLKSFYAQIPISGGEGIILFIASLGFIYILFLLNKASINTLWQRYLVTLLLFFMFTHFHPQWLIWIIPFLIIELAKTNLKNILSFTLIIISWFVSLFFFDNGLNIGLFAPLFPELFNSKPILESLGMIDYNFSRSILQSIFVAASLVYIYTYFPKREEV